MFYKKLYILKYQNLVFIIDAKNSSYSVMTKEEFFLNYDINVEYICLNLKRR